MPFKISGDERDEGNGSELESTVDDEDGDEDLECEMVNVEAIRAQQQQMDDDVTPEGKEVLSRVQQGRAGWTAHFLKGFTHLSHFSAASTTSARGALWLGRRF